MKHLVACGLLVLASAVAHADPRYNWECRDAQQNTAPGKTIVPILAPGQRHFILSEGAATRQLIGVTSAGNCSTATLVIGSNRYQCVLGFAVDGSGRNGKKVDRTECANKG